MRLVSSKSIIFEAIQDFGLDYSDFRIKALNWVGRALELLGTLGTQELKECIEIRDRRGFLPCGMSWINWVEYCGQVLPLDGYNRPSCPQGMTICEREYYKEQGPYIITSFEKGSVVIHYSGIAMDEDGCVMVPDEVNTIEAIKWFIMYKLLLSRPHPTMPNFQVALDMFNDYTHKAQNNHVLLRPEEREWLRRTVAGVVTNPRYYERYFRR